MASRIIWPFGRSLPTSNIHDKLLVYFIIRFIKFYSFLFSIARTEYLESSEGSLYPLNQFTSMNRCFAGRIW